MNEDTRDLASLIPQVFFDLIGRLVPGLALLLVGAVLLVDLGTAALIPTLASRMSTGAAILLGTTFAYLLGALLGGIGPALIHQEWNAKSATQVTLEVPRGTKPAALRPSQLAFLYDALQTHNRAAGARLVKLHAEQHMCTALATGSLSLVVLCVASPRPPTCPVSTVVAISSLLVTAGCSYLLYVHLAIRARRLLLNYCELVPELSGLLSREGETKLSSRKHS